jgi:hypothetical protein
LTDHPPDRSELATSLVERAAAHQMRALATFREAQAPTRAMSIAQRRRLLSSVMEHLVRAADLLSQAQAAGSANPEFLASLEVHRARLTTVTESAERLLDTFVRTAPPD